MNRKMPTARSLVAPYWARVANRMRIKLRRIRSRLGMDPNRFLRDVSGVIHIGANGGPERHLYARHNLRVIWIEPIPEAYARLQANLVGFPNQRAFQQLITDRDDVEYLFHISNNRGASSSIFDLKDHKYIWPEVTYITTTSLSTP